MKKFAVLAVAAMLVLSLAGQAAAYFEDFKLVRTIYDGNPAQSTEIGSDLGLYAFKTAAEYGNNIFVGDLIGVPSFVSPLSSVKISYYAYDDNTIGAADYWITGETDGDGLTLLGRKGSGLQTATTQLQGYYQGLGGSTVSASKGATNSFFQKFESNGTAVASFANSLDSTVGWEATVSLAELLGPDHFVDTLLYYFDYNNNLSTTQKTPGTEVALIRTYLDAGADGFFGTADDKIGTVINPQVVPIPGSVLLLASGLLGLFGFRRKKA
jgi:hypothetical protein